MQDPRTVAVTAARISTARCAVVLCCLVVSAAMLPGCGKSDRTAAVQDPGSSPDNETSFAGSKAGQEWDQNGLKMKFCWCPPGKFTMGSPKSEPQRNNNEDQVEVT